MASIKWEKIFTNDVAKENVITERAKIPGGWLVRCFSNFTGDRSVGVTFVPDQDWQWD